MIAIWFARIVGIVLLVVAVVGFFIEGEHMLGFMNVDIALDIIRLVLAIALLVVGFARVSRAARNTVLAILGISYLLLAILGFMDREVFGLLPTGLTGFDLGFHIVVGIAAIALMFVRDDAGHADHAGPATRTDPATRRGGTGTGTARGR